MQIRVLCKSVIIGVIILLLCLDCKKDFSPFNLNEQCIYPFAIYFLDNNDLKIKDITSQGMDNVSIQDIPWLTNADIEMYDWSSHCIYLKQDKSYFIKGYGTEAAKDAGFDKSWYYKPFAVTAYNQLWYLGYFYPFIFPDKWLMPEISLEGIYFYPEDILYIGYDWLYSEDIRYQESIKNALIESDIFSGGISAELDTLNGINFIEIGDTSTIEYNIILTNNDEDCLLIFDPDLAGSEIFHAYNSGIVLLAQQDQQNIYRAPYKKVKIPDNWADYYVQLQSGESIKRSIRLKGYPYIPDGRYYLQFEYNGYQGIEKPERILEGNRYWIGPTRSFVYTCTKTGGVCKSQLSMYSNSQVQELF